MSVTITPQHHSTPSINLSNDTWAHLINCLGWEMADVGYVGHLSPISLLDRIWALKRSLEQGRGCEFVIADRVIKTSTTTIVITGVSEERLQQIVDALRPICSRAIELGVSVYYR